MSGLTGWWLKHRVLEVHAIDTRYRLVHKRYQLISCSNGTLSLT
jgi:hypothetical protein